MQEQSTECMNARILQVCPDRLYVRDRCSGQEVLVHTPDACAFHAGQWVCVEHPGRMTMSIPPQISALRITRPGCC